MTEPIYSECTERWWSRTPAIQKVEDAKQGWPLKALISVMGDRIQEVADLADRFDYVGASDAGVVSKAPSGDNQASTVATTTVYPTGGSPVVWTLPTGTSKNFYLSRPADNEYVQWVQYLQGGDYQFQFDYIVLSSTVGGVASLYVNEQFVTTYDLRQGGAVGSVATSVTLTLANQPRGYYTFRLQFDTEFQIDSSSSRTINVSGMRVVNVRDGGPNSASDLVNPLSAEPEWLPWIGQLYGVKVDVTQPVDVQRQSISSGYTGFLAGTKNAMAAAVATQLTGTKSVTILPRTQATGTIGAAGVWDVCIVTRATEMPSGFDPVAFLIAQNAKPAGIKLWSRSFGATWGTMMTAFPHWSDWNGKSWATIMEAGLN